MNKAVPGTQSGHSHSPLGGQSWRILGVGVSTPEGGLKLRTELPPKGGWKCWAGDEDGAQKGLAATVGEGVRGAANLGACCVVVHNAGVPSDPSLLVYAARVVPCPVTCFNQYNAEEMTLPGLNY